MVMRSIARERDGRKGKCANALRFLPLNLLSLLLLFMLVLKFLFWLKVKLKTFCVLRFVLADTEAIRQ